MCRYTQKNTHRHIHVRTHWHACIYILSFKYGWGSVVLWLLVAVQPKDQSQLGWEETLSPDSGAGQSPAFLCWVLPAFDGWLRQYSFWLMHFLSSKLSCSISYTTLGSNTCAEWPEGPDASGLVWGLPLPTVCWLVYIYNKHTFYVWHILLYTLKDSQHRGTREIACHYHF